MPLQITDIVKNLPEWEKTGLNEAQTCQVIILRILHELGYDIWNPFEVCAQQNNVSSKYFPDFTISLNTQKCFIIEVKNLGKKLDINEDGAQATSYVNMNGLRWAILTNGKEWRFFDNKQEGTPEKKLAFTFTLNDAHATYYLQELLARQLWESPNANEQVSQNIGFIKVEAKLQKIMQYYALNEQGLKRAIDIDPELAEERQLAKFHFDRLKQRILLLPTTQPEIPVTNTVEKTTVEPLQIAKSHFDGLKQKRQAILQSLHDTIYKHRNRNFDTDNLKNPYVVKINDATFNVSSWRSIYIAVAEVCIDFQKESAIQLVLEKNPAYQRHQTAYYELQGKYLFVHASSEIIRKHVKKLLEALELPENTLEVICARETYHLP